MTLQELTELVQDHGAAPDLKEKAIRLAYLMGHADSLAEMRAARLIKETVVEQNSYHHD